MLSAGLRIGKYELTRQLGRGGFGVVFVATDHSLGRECALKFLLPEHGARADLLERFVNEARAAASIGHTNIVTVFECGVFSGTETRADGMAYIAMELLEGESLAQRLSRQGPMSEIAAVVITRQVTAALGAAHADGIVHRDLKPDNIFLVPDPSTIGGERVKVLDFGIAKLADNADTQMTTATFAVFGTPRYMSPEQCRSSTNVDARTDIYALGCIMFELVCGRAPFAGESGEQIAHHQLSSPPRVRTVRGEIGEAYDETVAAMLGKRADDRPATMADVIKMLDGKLAFGTRPVAPPASTALGGAETIVAASDPTVHSMAPAEGSASVGNWALPKSDRTSGSVEPASKVPTAVAPRRTWVLLAGFAVIAAIAATVVIVATNKSVAPAKIDAGVSDAVVADAFVVKKQTKCDEYAATDQWAKLASCAEELRAAGDPATADAFVSQAQKELAAFDAKRELEELLLRYPVPESVAAVLAKIEPASRYTKPVNAAVRAHFREEAIYLMRFHLCELLDTLRSQVHVLPIETREEVARATCTPRGDLTKYDCTIDGHHEIDTARQKNDWSRMLELAIDIHACRANLDKESPQLTIAATIAACHLRMAVIARHYFHQITVDRSPIIAECKNTGISFE